MKLGCIIVIQSYLPAATFVLCAAMVGCRSPEPDTYRDLRTQIALRDRRIDELEIRLQDADLQIVSLQGQLRNLRGTGGAPPPPVFELDRIEVQEISGGTDTNGDRRDDGVTVYFRPLDYDGDVIKREGKIVVKLIDSVGQTEPRLVGHVAIEEPAEIGQYWYGKFWTNHYKIYVPFVEDYLPTPGAEIDAQVTFTDFLTGRVFIGREVVKISTMNLDDDTGP